MSKKEALSELDVFQCRQETKFVIGLSRILMESRHAADKWLKNLAAHCVFYERICTCEFGGDIHFFSIHVIKNRHVPPCATGSQSLNSEKTCATGTE